MEDLVEHRFVKSFTGLSTLILFLIQKGKTGMKANGKCYIQ